jgi:hypothetical protein
LLRLRRHLIGRLRRGGLLSLRLGLWRLRRGLLLGGRSRVRLRLRRSLLLLLRLRLCLLLSRLRRGGLLRSSRRPGGQHR